jgi:hypothetical protein
MDTGEQVFVTETVKRVPAVRPVFAGRSILRQKACDQFDVLQRIVIAAGSNGVGAMHREVGAQGSEEVGF